MRAESKNRVRIPDDIAADVQFRSSRICCVCRERGRPYQLHHIDEDPSNNAPENLAVLCLLCHDDTQVRGGFGRKLDAAQVVRFRDDWYAAVEMHREEALKVSARGSGQLPTSPPTTREVRSEIPEKDQLTDFVGSLPERMKAAYEAARPLWNSGNTADMRQGSYDVIEVLEQILVTLMSWFPEGHFSGHDSRDYIGGIVASRFAWHRARQEPLGVGTGGTMVGLMAAGDTQSDLEVMVKDIGVSLIEYLDTIDPDDWRSKWDGALSHEDNA